MKNTWTNHYYVKGNCMITNKSGDDQTMLTTYITQQYNTAIQQDAGHRL